MINQPHRRRSKPRSSPHVLERINPDAAGIDCGSTAHFVAVPSDIYHALKGDFVYRDPGADAYDAQQRTRILRRLRQRADQLGLRSSIAKRGKCSEDSFLGVAKRRAKLAMLDSGSLRR